MVIATFAPIVAMIFFCINNNCKGCFLRARLVIVFKNCYLKRCENYGLKNVVKKRIFSVNKTKKCVWYHDLNNIFQYSKNIKYVFSMCVLNDKKKLNKVQNKYI